ncbi:methyltransferase domain-containing protein [Clostridium bovifaecis]|uniref:Methyltransferase domain-containing protein n=1 Tax=Clostridium bovifaecis TaxID=2184719 RepID=A0A6I6ERE1_9CLOT|nr:methyltransferase domain-containing protein [Clostridium bovifaecis]
MGFYEEFSKHYDVVFPLGEAQLNFIKKRAKDKKRILDLAAGTGNYSIALAKEGYDVVAIDLDSEMVRKIKEKARGKEVKIRAISMDMKEVDKIEDKFDLIFCIGNSLVHLDSKEEIEEVISKLYNLLNKDGVLIIQIINYDRIIEKNIKGLPTIDRSEKGIRFVRDYEEKDGKILFKTKLIIKSGEEVYENCVPLYPLLSRDLDNILRTSGFSSIEIYGGFNEAEYNVDSMVTIISAMKK